MSPDGHWEDERLIDEILHKLPQGQAQQLHAHLRICASCLRRYEEWQSLLNRHPDANYESDALKQRLMHSVAQANKKKEFAGARTKKKLVGFGLATIAVLAFLLFQFQPASFQNDYTTIQDDTAERATFIHDPHTVQYDVTPVMAADIRGDVWLNDTTKEMLIRVEGLVPMVHKDYQMWFIDSDDRLHGKVLELQNGKAVLYLYGEGVQRIQHVRTSLEPKGGSPIPTGTDTFIVELDR